MFTNRHLVVALLVAPVLALLAWFAVGQFGGEEAAPAQPGQSYPLVEQPNCRYASGACDLKNAELSLRLTLSDGASPRLRVTASHGLERIQLAVAAPGSEARPTALAQAADGSWFLRLPVAPDPGERIRLVAQAAGSFYYGDAATAFAGSPAP